MIKNKKQMNLERQDYNVIILLLLLFTIALACISFMDRPKNMSIYTAKDIYHIEFKNNRVFTETGQYDIQFESFRDLSDWVENKTATDL